MYNVIVGDQQRETELRRQEAVDAAKELSRDTHRQVKVLNDDKFERLVFRRGRLLESTYVTQDRRNRRGPLS